MSKLEFIIKFFKVKRRSVGIEGLAVFRMRPQSQQNSRGAYVSTDILRYSLDDKPVNTLIAMR
jgi:hypothetical protein